MGKDKDLEELRRLAVDLAKDGHDKQAADAARLHDAMKADREKNGK